MDKELLRKIKLSEEELLLLVRQEREYGEKFSREFKLEIEADLKLLKNKRDKKKDEKLVGDSTLFNVHTALVSRSYKSKNTIKIKGDKNGIDREIKMLNAVIEEDNNSAIERALKYYLYDDKFATGLAIKSRVGWDGTYKRNISSIVNPLTWIPDPNGDYFLGNYKFTGFFGIEHKDNLKQSGYDVDEMMKTYPEGAKELKERLQRLHKLYPDLDKLNLVDVYYHFTTINGVKIRTLTCNLDSLLLDGGLIKPNSKLEEKNPEAITFPFAFYYWKPDRNNPFGDRPANYTRDVQLQKAEISNLRLNKMRAELYPMYLYNSDLINKKDLSFGFNKGIPVGMGMGGQQFNIGNVMAPMQKDLRIDTSFAVEQSLDRQVEKSTSIGEVVQGTTPTKRETLGTNQLIQTNTDVNLELNEEIHSVGDEQRIKIYFGGYYQNFADGDKKLTYAGSTTGQEAIVLKRADFIYEGNLNISIETSIGREDRLRKELAATLQVTPLIIATLNPASKLQWQRFMSERAGIPQETIDEILIDTPQMAMQKIENELLKLNMYVPISQNDDHEQHLIVMGTNINTDAGEIHKTSHLIEFIKQGIQLQPEQGVNENSMANSMASQGMAQAGSILQNNP